MELRYDQDRDRTRTRIGSRPGWNRDQTHFSTGSGIEKGWSHSYLDAKRGTSMGSQPQITQESPKPFKPGLRVGWDGTKKIVPWDEILKLSHPMKQISKISVPLWDGPILKNSASHPILSHGTAYSSNMVYKN